MKRCNGCTSLCIQANERIVDWDDKDRYLAYCLYQKTTFLGYIQNPEEEIHRPKECQKYLQV